MLGSKIEIDMLDLHSAFEIKFENMRPTNEENKFLMT